MNIKIKMFLSSSLFLLFAISMIFAGGAKKESGDKSLEKIVQKNSFVIGLDDSLPPLGFRNEKNEIVGYDIDLAKEVVKRLGIELKLQPIDWAAKEQELNTGKIDCIWNGFTITPERENALSFTKPYLNNAQIVVVRSDSGIKTLADLKGKRVALQAGSSAADALESAAEFKKSLKEVVELKDNLTAFMDLERKGVEAVILDEVVARYNIKQSGKSFAILNESLSTEKYGIGFRKNDLQLRDEVQKILEQMTVDGTVTELSIKWFEKDISVIGK